MKWKERDSFAVKEILGGNVPAFLRNLVAIDVSTTDSATDKIIRAVYYVAPDYLSIGNNRDWPVSTSHHWLHKRLLTVSIAFYLQRKWSMTFTRLRK